MALHAPIGAGAGGGRKTVRGTRYRYFLRGKDGRYPGRLETGRTEGAIVSGYRLELGKTGSPSSKTPPFGAASDAVSYLDMWGSSGGTVTGIMRNGEPIDEATLRKDAEAERKKRGK